MYNSDTVKLGRDVSGDQCALCKGTADDSPNHIPIYEEDQTISSLQ